MRTSSAPRGSAIPGATTETKNTYMKLLDNYRMRANFTVALQDQIPGAYTQEKREITEQTRLTEDFFWTLARIRNIL